MTLFGFILSIIAMAGILLYLLRTRYKEVMSEINAMGTAEIISTRAEFFGMSSKGFTQIRGSGILALFQETIAFIMLFPRTTVHIQRGSIISVTVQRSFLGKTKFKKLMVIRYTDDTGREEECAWLVENLQDWLTLLENHYQLQ